MAKKLAFILELENGAKLVSEISDIELRYKSLGKEIRETEKAIEILKTGSVDQKALLEAEGITLEKLETKYKVLKAEQIDLSATKKKLNGDIRDQIKLFDNLGNRVPEDSLLGLRREYRELRKEIDNMDGAARRSADGLEKIAQAKGIKDQINEIGKSVGDFREQVGSYEEAVGRVFERFGIGKGGGGISNIIDPIVGILGGGGIGGLLGGGGVLDFLGPVGSDGLPTGGGGDNPLSGLLTALGPGGLLATAGAATLIATADYVADVTLEFEKLNQKVGQLTNLTGRDLADATVQIKTIAEVYNEEFDEILRAAQSTSKAFNSDIGDTLSLIQQGLAGGANLNNEFLDSLREYPRLIQEAGLSQEQFFEVLVRSTQEGIYSDKGIDAIKEGGLRIREQTEATKKALTNAFGKEATDQLLEGVNNGSVSTFEAIQQVSKGLTDLDLTAEQTGTLLADVFGGPGEDAGVEFIKSLQDIDGELENVINTTDAYSQRQNAQYEATLALNTAQQNLASQFAGTGVSLGSLGTQLKAFGTDVLDGILLKTRTIANAFSEEGFFAGLQQVAASVSPFDVTGRETAQRQQDLDALRQINEREKEIEEERIERNKRGANGINGLREEQQKLTQQIQDAKAKGEPYQQLLEEYNQITDRLTKSTNVLTKSVEASSNKIQGEVGSLTRLRAELSAIKKEIDDDGNVTSQDTARLEAKQKEIDEAEARLNSLTTEGQEKAILDEIKLRREANELKAELSIDNEKKLQETLKNIRIQSDIETLEQRIRSEREGTQEIANLRLELEARRNDLSDSNSNLDAIDNESIIANAVALSNEIAQTISATEEELQLRLRTIQLNATNTRLRQRLSEEELTNAERLNLEREYQDNVKQIRENDSQIDADRQTELSNDRLNQKIAELAREAETIDEFEKQKNLIILEAELERLEIERERKIENGEKLLEIERDIAEKELEINQEKNAEIIKAQQKRIEDQKRFEKQMTDIQVGALTDIGSAFGEFFLQSGEDQKDFAQSSLLIVLDTVEKTINLLLAQILAKEIASKSLFGIGTAAVLTGLVRAAFGVAKGAINANEEGAYLMPEYSKGTITRNFSDVHSHTKDNLKRGTIFQGYSHASRGEHFMLGGKINEAEYGEAIINKKSTQRFKPLLSMINSYNGWGKAFADGAVLGNETPNLVPVEQGFTSQTSISDEQMFRFASIVAGSQAETLTPIVESIVERFLDASQQEERLRERKGAAEQNSLI